MASLLISGQSVTMTAAANIEPGDVVQIASDFYGVATGRAQSGQPVNLNIAGQYKMTAGGAVTLGAPVYHTTGDTVSATSATAACIGRAATAASASGQVVVVILNQK